MVGFKGTTVSPEIIDLIQNYHVGGIILFSRNAQDTQQVLALTTRLQQIARDAGHRYPLLIAIDQENGIVQRLGKGSTTFPGNMALGATESDQLVYDIALATGNELKALGINMNLAPVVDVNNNPANPVIGSRSFGEDPYQVAKFSTTAVKGLQSARVISSIKHFPGHGDTAVDSHLALPTIPYPLERLEALELVPFIQCIEAGAESVMVAHINFPALTHDTLPATVSPAIIQGLLREKLGFKRVIISDCLEMHAIAKTIGTEQASLMALQAGTDLVLVSHTYARQRGSIEAAKQALQSGSLSRAKLLQGVERVLELKTRYLSWDESPATTVAPLVGGQAHQRLRDHAYELSTTLLRDKQNLLPLQPAPSAQILALSLHKDANMVEDVQYAGHFLADNIRAYHPQVKALSVSPHPTAAQQQEVLQIASTMDIVIAATVNTYLDAEQAELMRALTQFCQKLIGIAVGMPYDLLVFPQLGTYLLTYEYTQPALQAAVRVIFGKVPPQGHLPVSLPGLSPLTLK